MSFFWKMQNKQIKSFCSNPAFIFLMLFLAIAIKGMAEEETAVIYDDHGKRNPFVRLVDPSGAIVNAEKELMGPDMRLDGIIIDKNGNNVAIINGVLVKANDTIGTFVITAIQSDAIILTKGTEQVILKLKKED